MRRLASHLGIGLLSLFLSGWSGVLAVALCPHAGMSQSHSAAVENHACCPAKLEQAEAEHSTSHHDGERSLKAQPDCHSNDDSQGMSVGQPAGACGHCVGRSEFPNTTAITRELTSQKRDAGKLSPRAALMMTPFSLPVAFAQQFVPSQHAPPGNPGRKHLLLGVLLI